MNPDNAPRRTEPEPGPSPSKSETRRSWWPGWIWAIPIAALAVVAWLGIRALFTSGTEITVTFDTAAGMSPQNTKVTYRELKVGQLTGLKLSKNGKQVEAKLDIDDDAKKFLTTGTRFWLKGSKPSFSDLSSLKSVLSGPTIVMWPGPGKPAHHFTGLDQAPTIADWTGPHVYYRVSFTGDVGKLKRGAPVELRGFTIGEVTGFSLDWEAKSQTLSMPVTIALDPARLNAGRESQPAASNQASALNQMLEHLIRQGLRARLSRNPPFIGDEIVTLEFQPNAEPADLVTGDGQFPEIPADGSGGIATLMAKVGNLPIEQIGNNVREITEQIKDIVSSPEIGASIDHLNATLADVDKTVRQTAPQIGPLIKSLRKTADELQDTAHAATQVLGAAPTQRGNLRTAIHELTETARSIRSLANYLDEHPEAVLSGR